MKLNKTVIFISLVIISLATLIFAIWLPSRTTLVNFDVTISDENDNYQLEVGEELHFKINDSTTFKDPKMFWEFGNGDSITQKNSVVYNYQKKGEYLVTLTINDKFEIPKKIKVIDVIKNKAIDSVPKIHGVDKAYINEELVFLTTTPGIKSWYWEFGETGTVDAYEKQVIYTYKKPGIYNVILKTNQSRFPVYHRIEILALFDPITTESIDSLNIVALDIKKHLQSIADASVNNTNQFYKNLRYIENKYNCENEEMVMIINGTKYNDLFSYCQGLHYLSGKGSKTINIDEVVVDTIRCIQKVQINQSIIKK